METYFQTESALLAVSIETKLHQLYSEFQNLQEKRAALFSGHVTEALGESCISKSPSVGSNIAKKLGKTLDANGPKIATEALSSVNDKININLVQEGVLSASVVK